jgi:hypothetical protein
MLTIKKRTITTLKRVLILSVLFLFVFSMQTVQAQSFPDDVDDTAPAAPIDSYMYLGLIAAAIYGYVLLRKTQQQQEQQQN